MNIEKNINNLIVAYCLGVLSREEFEKLKAWKDADDTHKKYFAEQVALYRESKKIAFLEANDPEKSWVALKPRLQSRNHHLWAGWRRYAAAAAIFICLSVIVYWALHHLQKDVNYIDFAQVASPGSVKALLYMADGQLVNLGDPKVDGTMLDEITGINDVEADTKKGIKQVIKRMHNIVKVPRGGEFSITLSDGTKIKLNSESELKYPVKFDKKKREVYLKGEAYFDVKSDKNRPFIVHVFDTKIKVLGTRFIVSAYHKDETISTTLVEGRVEVFKAKRSIELLPAQQSIVAKGIEGIRVNEVDTSLYTSWVNGIFEFQNMRLEMITHQLTRWYNRDFKFKNENLKNIRFTGEAKRSEDLGFFLNLIQRTTKVRFEIKEDEIWVY